MDTTELKNDWLASNAVTAFVGVLLIAQSWQQPDGTYEFPFNVMSPTLAGFVQLAGTAALFLSSFVFALASMVPPFRHPVLRAAPPVVPFLGFFVLVAFFFTWLSVPELIHGETWSPVLFYGGAVMFFFILFRSLHGSCRLLFRSKPKQDVKLSKPHDVVSEEATEQASLRKCMRRLCENWRLRPRQWCRKRGITESATLLLLVISTIFFVLGLLLLLLAGKSDVWLAISVASVGLSAVVLSYSLWSFRSDRDWRNPGEFVQEVMKPVVTLFALGGIALVFQGLGALAGLDGLRSVGDTFAKLFGGS